MVGLYIVLAIVLGLYHVACDFIDYLIYKSANLVDKGIDITGDLASKGRDAAGNLLSANNDNVIVRGLEKANNVVGKGIDKINTETFKLGVVPSLRVILNGIRVVFAEIVVLFVLFISSATQVDYDDAWSEVWHNVGAPVTLGIIGYTIYKKLTLGWYVRKKARDFIDLQVSKKAEISAKEFMNLPPIWRCQKWNFKTKGQVTFYYVRDTFHQEFRERLKKEVTDTVKDDRIYLYLEYPQFAPQLKRYGEQMNQFLPFDFTTVNNVGFFSKRIAELIGAKVNSAIDSMPNLFSQPNVYDNVAAAEELNGLYSHAFNISNNDKIGLYAPFVFQEIESQKKTFQITQAMQAKPDAPILYKKNPPGLINSNGIYQSEPDFEGAGCVDCGVLTMPEDDEDE